MIDIHSHVLFGVDDGSKDITQSINMIKEAINAGFDTICVTPHYLEPYFKNNKRENDKVLGKLQEELIKQDIKINLILSNEVYITTNVKELLEFEKISTIGDSKYLLIEFPMNHEIKYVKDMLIEIRDLGYKIIIAHPERYSYVQKDISYLNDFLDMGIIFQCNYGSIIGKYGMAAKNTIKKLLKRKMVQCFGTDSHRDMSTYNDMKKILKKIEKVAGTDYYNIIINENPTHIIKDEDVIVLEYLKK